MNRPAGFEEFGLVAVAAVEWLVLLTVGGLISRLLQSGCTAGFRLVDPWRS